MFDTFCTQKEGTPSVPFYHITMSGRLSITPANFRFSRKALTCRLPLYAGNLTLVIFVEDPTVIGEDPYEDYDTNWGAPRRQHFFLERNIYYSDKKFWEKAAPIIQF
jgi:hypothetical protein